MEANRGNTQIMMQPLFIGAMLMLNQAGINQIKSYEGLRLQSYQDQRGVWTVGYGCTGPGIGPGMSITEEQAESMFADRAREFCHGLDPILPPDLNDNQYSALCSLTYNIGLNAFTGSTLHRKLQEGVRGQGITQELLKWNHVDGVVNPGLTQRRQAEADLFNAPL